MKMKTLMTASALVIGLGLSSAAIANDQNQNNNAGNNGGGIGSTTTVWNDLIDSYYQDNAADTLSVDYDLSSEENGNTAIVATQYLYAENSNSMLDEVVDLCGLCRHSQPGMEHRHQCQHAGSHQHRRPGYRQFRRELG
jgi:hypothetical protein